MMNNGEATHSLEGAHNVAIAHRMEAQTGTQSNQSVAHHKMAGTQSGKEGCENHPPYGKEDQL